ncbi:MAG: hypothetical protein ACM3IH_20605 [Sphingobacteriales bacterium]
MGKDSSFFAPCVLQHLIRDFVNEKIFFFILIGFDDAVIIHSTLPFASLPYADCRTLVERLGSKSDRLPTREIERRKNRAAMDIAFVAPLSKFQL